MAKCGLLHKQVCEGEREEYNNFSKISWGITNNHRQLFTEKYTYITSTKD